MSKRRSLKPQTKAELSAFYAPNVPADLTPEEMLDWLENAVVEIYDHTVNAGARRQSREHRHILRARIIALMNDGLALPTYRDAPTGS